MKETLEYLESLAPYTRIGPPPALWEFTCEQACRCAEKDAARLIGDVKELAETKLISRVESDGYYDDRGNACLGAFVLHPNNTYRQQVGRQTIEDERHKAERGVIHSGTELEFTLYRKMQLSSRPILNMPAFVTLSLNLNNAVEIMAFRDIYLPNKRIIEKLLAMALIEYDVDNECAFASTRIKSPATFLKSIMSADRHDYSGVAFSLCFDWCSNTQDDEGIRALRSLAILFDSIQHAVITTSAKDARLVEYWHHLPDRHVSYPKAIKSVDWTGPAEEEAGAHQKVYSEWQRITDKLVNTITKGPFIQPNGKRGDISKCFCHSGYSLVFSADNRKMIADILHYTSYDFSHWPLYLKKRDVPFELCHHEPSNIEARDLGLVNLRVVLDALYSYAKIDVDIHGLLDEIAPALSKHGSSPLKRNTFQCLSSELSNNGYAAVSMTAGKDYVRIRIAWVYSPFRAQKAIGNYITCGTLRVVFGKNVEITKVEIMPYDARGISGELKKRMLDLCGSPKNILSPVGVNAAIECFMWKHGVSQCPRTAKHRKRIEYVARHQDKWGDKYSLADLLIKEGLYSPKTPRTQVAYGCEVLIREAKAMFNKPD